VRGELGDRVRVSVHDEGPGIPPEDQPHIFERFYRADPSRARGDGAGQGSGLGLAIAKAIVEAHGGEIGLESDGRKGTTVYFVLPQPVKRTLALAGSARET
jgi:signal transduction histidine kinase